jgi:NTP pyrophosphatase (non-canonical NTP hydrolase)
MENERESESASRQASGLAQRLKEDGRQTLDQRKRSAAERVDEIAQAIDRAGAQFSQNEPTLADYASRVATTVGNLATRLREGSVEELVEDAPSSHAAIRACSLPAVSRPVSPCLDS